MQDKQTTQELEKGLQRTEAQLRAVLEISQTLASTHEPGQLLTLIMDKVTDLMDADRSTLFLVDHEREEIWSKVLQGEEMIQLRLPIGQGFAGWVAQTGETLNIMNAYNDPRFHSKVDKKTGYITKSLLTMPLQNQLNEIIGVVQVLNKNDGGPFTEEDQLLLKAICAQAAIFLENAQLYHTILQKNTELLRSAQQIEQRRYELDILFDIEQQMSRAFNLDDMMSRILSRASQLLGCEAGSIALLDEGSGELYFHTVTGQKSQAIQPVKLAKGEGFIGWTALHGEALLSNQPTKDRRFRKDIASAIEFPVRSVLCVPLQREDKSLGAIQLLNKKNKFGFTEDDLKLLRLIAAQISRAVEIGRQREEQEKQNRLATIGQLLSGLVHDLKTPMTLISGYAQMLAQPQNDEKRNFFSAAIEKQVERLNQMTREVLAFARGDSTLLVRKIHLNKFMPEIEQHLQQEFSGYPIELTVHSDYLGNAYFDEVKIQRLIYNLARNARQAMPQGGTFDVRVELADPQRLRFSFSDTGNGIPHHIQANIFDSFVTGRPSKGTGLGLAIVKKIVDEHQGTIRFNSIPGQGTTFIVEIPLQTHDATNDNKNEKSLSTASAA